MTTDHLIEAEALEVTTRPMNVWVPKGSTYFAPIVLFFLKEQRAAILNGIYTVYSQFSTQGVLFFSFLEVVSKEGLLHIQ